MQLPTRRIFGNQGARENFIPLTNGVSTPILQQDGYRQGIIFSNPSTQTVYISTNSPAIVNRGIILTNTQFPLALAYKDYGSLVNMAWFALCNAVGGNITAIECFDTEYLSQLDDALYGKGSRDKRSDSSSPIIGYADPFSKSPTNWLDLLGPADVPVLNRFQWQGSSIGQGDDVIPSDRTDNHRYRVRLNSEE